MTKVEQEMTDLMESILDNKEEIQMLEDELESLKISLLTLMENNHKYEFETKFAKAKIISFGRERLIKEDVLMTINEFNKGRLKEKININDLIKVSKVCFVLVKAKE